MRRWKATAVAAMATVSLLALPSGSPAFIEIGGNCTGDKFLLSADQTFFQAEADEDHLLPLAATSPGVITRWRANVTKAAAGAATQKLVVLRALGNPGEFLVRGESAPEQVAGGPNAFQTRIPVGPGDRVGVHAPDGLWVCPAITLNKVGAFKGDAPVGSTVVSDGTLQGYVLPVSAIVEPDADGDGHGDETQDHCPGDPGTQGACPTAAPPPAGLPLALDSYALTLKRSLLVLVSTTSPATVRIAATARAPGAGKRGGRRRAAIRIGGRGRRVSPGQVGRLRLPFTKRLLSTLRALPKKRSLRLRVRVSGRDATGRAAEDRFSVRLKGRRGQRRRR